VLGTIYVGSGNALANASTYGRVAGRSAAAFAQDWQRCPPIDWAALGVEQHTQ
jgi:succinate dehydrogenase/fumarate reductase flavoprotein subunit